MKKNSGLTTISTSFGDVTKRRNGKGKRERGNEEWENGKLVMKLLIG